MISSKELMELYPTLVKWQPHFWLYDRFLSFSYKFGLGGGYLHSKSKSFKWCSIKLLGLGN